MHSCEAVFQGYEYGRSGNPSRAVLEECLASLDDAKYGLAFSSGLAAVTGLCALLESGDHIITGDIYTVEQIGCGFSC
uniref:cystathionine gamma-lyase n=1 Tax=Rhodnius prolixus TaxID=13249 RepID=T1I6E8_RHOPR